MFLFINQYSKGEGGDTERPDRHAVGSHVQRHINLTKRSKIRSKERSRLKRSLTFGNRGIFPYSHQSRHLRVERTSHSDGEAENSSPSQPSEGEELPLQGERIPRQAMVTFGEHGQTQIGADRGKKSSYVDSGPEVHRLNHIVSSESGIGNATSVQSGILTELEVLGIHQPPADWFSGVTSPSPYQVIGHGAADPFAATALPINAFYGGLIDYFQQSFTFRSMERLCRNSGTRWISKLICDKATMHGLYANALFLAARLSHDDDDRKEMMVSAWKHQNFTIAATRDRIQRKENLSQVAFATISLLMCAYNVGDWASYKTHLNGMTSVVQLVGGYVSIDYVLQLLLLVGELQSSSHMLTRPAISSQAWPRQDWHKYYTAVDVEPSLDARNRLSPEEIPTTKAIHSEVWEIFREIRDLHRSSVLSTQHAAPNPSTHSSTVQSSLQFRYHFVNISLLNCYCSLQDMHDGNGGAKAEALNLSRAFLVALMCCHQLLYHAIVDPSVVRMGYIPFFHIREHLRKLGCLCQDPSSLQPEIVDLLMWIAFIGAYDEVSRGGAVDPLSVQGPNTTDFLKLASLRHKNGRFHTGARATLERFLYFDTLFTPVLDYLQYVWDCGTA